MPVAAIQGDTVIPNLSDHTQCGSISLLILAPLQERVLFGVKYFAVIGSPLTPHTYRIDGDCDPHVAPLGCLTGAGSSKVFMGGLSANRVGDVADGDGLISGPGAINKVIIGG